MAHAASHGHHAKYFDQSDPSAYMLGLPKSHPRLRAWFVLAILTGTVIALAVFVLGNWIF